jgi:uncharacterized protein (TIGR00369 family)
MSNATPTTVEGLNAVGGTMFPGLIGLELLELSEGHCVARIIVGPRHLAPNHFLHAGVIVALADSACGSGTMASLPPGAESFTTLELKTNFQSTVRDGAIRCVARRMHGGRTTQIWDATVTSEASGKTLGLFRCTQLLLYPRSERAGS